MVQKPLEQLKYTRNDFQYVKKKSIAFITWANEELQKKKIAMQLLVKSSNIFRLEKENAVR